MTPYAALLDRERKDPAAPLLTYRDLGSGERMELSAASLANAVAKTAGMLRDELDAEPGAVIGIHLPLHWQRIIWLGACAATGTVFEAGAPPADCDVCVVDRARLGLTGAAREDVLASLAPFGLPERDGASPGVIEAAVAMRGHPDTFVPYSPSAGETPLLRHAGQLLSHGAVMERSAEELRRRGIGPGERFAIIDPDPLADILGLAGPLSMGGAAVLITNADAADMAAALREEGISRTQG